MHRTLTSAIAIAIVPELLPAAAPCCAPGTYDLARDVIGGIAVVQCTVIDVCAGSGTTAEAGPMTNGAATVGEAARTTTPTRRRQRPTRSVNGASRPPRGHVARRTSRTSARTTT